MSALTIIRASAGSGKTNRLADFFLKIALKESLDYFKSILGVTFTNKATEEMKHRIIEKLHQYSDPDRLDYPESLVRYFNGDTNRIREKSNVLLRKVLHGYSWFSIETIDTFFQRVIRAFTRELGIPGNYTVEIETRPILKYAIDLLLEDLGNNRDLLDWLTQFSEIKIDEGKSWDIRKDLLELGDEIFKEDFAADSALLREKLVGREKLFAFRDRLFAITSNFENRCKEYGKKALDVIKQNGLIADDFFQKRNGAVKIFTKLEQCDLKNSKGELVTQTVTAKKLLEDAQNWPSSDTSQKSRVAELASGILLPLLNEIVDFIGNEYRTYCTAEVVRKNLYTVGILVDLEEQIKRYRLEKNIFILGDAPKFLDRIINHNDTPFIYEKMGNRYGHILIDEFQDTSKLQWSNFKPLISNSLSQAKECLIVGDVKQAIYRWRNGDWNILANTINDEYPNEVIKTESLDTNWRSAENIVNFNNEFFQVVQKRIDDQLILLAGAQDADAISHREVLKGIYTNISQTVPENKKNKGTVSIRFFSKQTAREQPDYYVRPLIDSINLLLEKDYSQGEIAILVRNRKEGKQLADLLITSNSESKFYKPVNVISDESLFLSASGAVNLLVAALQYINEPEENLFRTKLIALSKAHIGGDKMTTDSPEMKVDAGFFNESIAGRLFPTGFEEYCHELSSLPLYELAEKLIHLFKLYMHNVDIPYIHAFLDLIYEYSHKNPPDIKGFIEYWEDEGNTKSVPATESWSAIRILTIHKAKGLEFRAVLIPFCSWDLGQKTNSIFWVKSRQAPFNFLPLIPINFSKALKDTLFAEEYYTELFKAYIDNLNLLYVAFTRAKETLIAFPLFNDSERKAHAVTSIGDLVYECLAVTEMGENEFFDNSSLTYQKGNFDITPAPPEKVSAEFSIRHLYSGQPAVSRVPFTTNGYEYFQDATRIRDKRIRGKVLHNLLAKIITLNDLDRIVNEAILGGIISNDEGKLLGEHIQAGMTNEIVKGWFDGTGEVLAERDILIPEATAKRPDRVVLWPNEVHVVDYKFSIELENKSYRRQVKDYMNIISKIEDKPVRGFIWYVDNNELVEIDE